MEPIIDLLFQARILKEIPRSGYHFLGSGKESVAEHSFTTAFIGFIMSQIVTGIDEKKLITMCLLHDLAEARTGDLNYVQKKYVISDEDRAIGDTVKDLPFGDSITSIIQEFNQKKSLEARLAHDADQLALVLELKSLSDMGYPRPRKWLPAVLDRITTDTGKKLAQKIMETEQDAWWLKDFSH